MPYMDCYSHNMQKPSCCKHVNTFEIQHVDLNQKEFCIFKLQIVFLEVSQCWLNGLNLLTDTVDLMEPTNDGVMKPWLISGDVSHIVEPMQLTWH